MAEEYIKREDAIKWLKNLFDDCGNYMPLWHYGEVLPKIIELLEVDVAPVVRCKDCKFAHMTYGGECKYCDAWESEESLYLDGDFFCAFGERKDDER